VCVCLCAADCVVFSLLFTCSFLSVFRLLHLDANKVRIETCGALMSLKAHCDRRIWVMMMMMMMMMMMCN